MNVPCMISELSFKKVGAGRAPKYHSPPLGDPHAFLPTFAVKRVHQMLRPGFLRLLMKGLSETELAVVMGILYLCNS